MNTRDLDFDIAAETATGICIGDAAREAHVEHVDWRGNMKRNRRGFTLIELLVVVVVLGILAAIAIPKYSTTKEKGFVSTLKADLRNLASLQELYHNDHYTYSTNMTALEFVLSDGVTVNFSEATGTGWSASAVHAGLPNESCAFFHGGAAAVSPATTESTITCSR